MKFSEESKQAREDKKQGRPNEQGYNDVYNLTIIGFGGTKPQNISVLNKQYGGKAYLLPCLPPALEHRSLRLPRRDFFRETLWARQYQEPFRRMHSLLVADINNLNIRQGRDRWILLSILDQVLNQAWSLRSHPQGWSQKAQYNDLPKHQRIWLDDFHLQERSSDMAWVRQVIADFTRWFIFAYEKNLGESAVPLRDDEFKYIQELLSKHQEAFL